MDFTIVISVTAAFISAFAALYASRQAKAMQLSNAIAIHENRMKVYKSFLRFSAQIKQRATQIDWDDFKYLAEASALVEFYFPIELASKVKAIQVDAEALVIGKAQLPIRKTIGTTEEIQADLKLHELMKKIRIDCQTTSDEFKKFLRVSAA